MATNPGMPAYPEYAQAKLSEDNVTAIVKRSRAVLDELTTLTNALSEAVDHLHGPIAVPAGGTPVPDAPEPSHVLFQARRVEIGLSDHRERLQGILQRIQTNL